MHVNSQHILVGANVTYQPIPEANTQAHIAPWSVILHSNAGPHLTPMQNLWRYISRQDITIEPHLMIDMAGQIVQAVPFNRRADCNAAANSWREGDLIVGAISIETQDLGAATLETTIWPQPQFDAITEAVAALGHHYGIPYTHPAHSKDRGIGHHSAYPQWSVYRGKTCPGAARIRQMDYVRAVAANKCACPA